ncbi:MAG: phage holin family protein [Chloroflexia bacterium]|nr:phage holin family protein [Chloroflexia bacterium]
MAQHTHDGARPGGGFSAPGAPGDRPGDRLAGEAQSIGALVGGVIKDLQDLVRAEIQLAKTELKEDATAAGKAAGAMAIGGVFGLIGFIFLMLALTYGLATWLPMWVSALIVAALLLVVAAVLALWGKKELAATKLGPEQTIATLKEDQQWAKQQLSSVKK